MVKEMAKLQFPAYGSLYFADAPIDPSSKVDLRNGFCIGPHCATQYWCLGPKESRFYTRRKPNRGPYVGFSRIPDTASTTEASATGAIQEHLLLLESCEKVIKELIKCQAVQNVAAPMLLHPDLHKRNIFVSIQDPSKITAVIDWQSSGVEPIFSFANETPDMVVDPSVDMPLFQDEPETPPETTQSSQANESGKEISICEQTFEVALKGWVPKLHDARTLDETLLRPIRYCQSSWMDGATALRQELLELSQHWSELGLSAPCPYQPSPEELMKHSREWEDFDSSQRLKLFLVRSINSNTDGWVPPEAWEAAKDANQSLFEEWMKTVSQSDDADMNEVRGRRLWPFDVDVNN
ncbi:MAG: hypothetical protein M1822_004153 [Bathelium mastoideum]|nr:MAG: hypothetical protein M1822_004153 [Bathelium mastoideum]